MNNSKYSAIALDNYLQNFVLTNLQSRKTKPLNLFFQNVLFVKLQQEFLSVYRITSYNVCYTKLLRLDQLQEGRIEILDLYGIPIYKSEFKNQNIININIQDKPKGIYILKIYSNDQIYTNKIIKE